MSTNDCRGSSCSLRRDSYPTGGHKSSKSQACSERISRERVDDHDPSVAGRLITDNAQQPAQWHYISRPLSQVILNLRRKDIIWELLDVHIAKPFEADAGVDRLSKRLLTLHWFMKTIETFVRRKTDTTMEGKKCSAAVAAKSRFLLWRRMMTGYGITDEPLRYRDCQNVEWNVVKTSLELSSQ